MRKKTKKKVTKKKKKKLSPKQLAELEAKAESAQAHIKAFQQELADARDSRDFIIGSLSHVPVDLDKEE